MGRNQRDEPSNVAISDVTSGDMDGADTVNEVTLETALSGINIAVNAIITSLETEGIVVTT